MFVCFAEMLSANIYYYNSLSDRDVCVICNVCKCAKSTGERKQIHFICGLAYNVSDPRHTYILSLPIVDHGMDPIAMYFLCLCGRFFSLAQHLKNRERFLVYDIMAIRSRSALLY
jgi:hypothetical protein